MEEVDKGCPMTRMGVSGWVFLLVPAYPGSPGSKAIKRLCVCVCVFSVLPSIWILDCSSFFASDIVLMIQLCWNVLSCDRVMWLKAGQAIPFVSVLAASFHFFAAFGLYGRICTDWVDGFVLLLKLTANVWKLSFHFSMLWHCRPLYSQFI